MDLGLQNRVAIVCAASKGLGRAAAAGFAQEGAHVVICARDRRTLVATARDLQELAAPGRQVVPVATDLTKPAHINRLVAGTIRRFGRVDILVTNAGGPPVAAFPDLDDTMWERGIELNLLSTVRCIRAVLPHMRKMRWGRIINITSFTAKQPVDDLVVSSTLRPGILGLAKILANQYGKEGILVNNVTPGFILTARQQEIGAVRAKSLGITTEEYLQNLGAGIPVGRTGMPEELAHVIVFLASERASYVNGSTIAVDGGLVKGLF